MLPYSGKIKDKKEIEKVVPAVDAIVLYASADSKLKVNLENLGLKILTDSKITNKTLVIIDGNNPPRNTKEQQLKVQKAIEARQQVSLRYM